jgi:hypothetical protein
MYLGEPLPNERYRVIFAFDGFSLHVKLAGTAHLDPATGQVEFTLRDMPQFNFQRFSAHIFGAERGIFSTPTHCGTYPVRATFRPWAYPDLPEQGSTQFFAIDSGPNGSPCPPAERPFSPTMVAGVSDNTGGSHTELVFELNRSDGEQNLVAGKVALPPGLSGVIAGIPYCPEASLAALAESSYLGATELRSPSCPASRVGSALATAGAGGKPVSMVGNVYLAGPYKGAPLSFAIVVPAVTGPYDLGNVVTRIALHVDPVSARVTASSDPLPQIIEGVPVRLRRAAVVLDRPGFAINPTNCSPFAIVADVTGDQGATARLSDHFQVANCGSLRFSPGLRIELRGANKRRGHPAIRAVLRGIPGQANLRRVQVTLPRKELFDNTHLETICTRVDFTAERCPAGSRIGMAQAFSPLLDQSLRGPVYLRTSSDRLPDLVFDLSGQVDIEIAGHTDSVGGRIRANFESLPDVPISRFVLNLAGGRRGLVVNSEDLCPAPGRAKAVMVGQNGRRNVRRIRLRAFCASHRKRRAPRLGAASRRAPVSSRATAD